MRLLQKLDNKRSRLSTPRPSPVLLFTTALLQLRQTSCTTCSVFRARGSHRVSLVAGTPEQRGSLAVPPRCLPVSMTHPEGPCPQHLQVGGWETPPISTWAVKVAQPCCWRPNGLCPGTLPVANVPLFTYALDLLVFCQFLSEQSQFTRCSVDHSKHWGLLRR